MPRPPVQENIYAHFIDQVKDYAIFAIDANGIVTSWNEGAQRIKGYEESEVIGQYFGMLFPEPARAKGKSEDELARAKRDGVFENEDWRRRKDGSLFWAKVTLTAIYSGEGDLIGLTRVTGDLTGRKEWEDRLARKNEELQRINADLDNFIYTASHDLKAPIANIEGFVKLLASKHNKKNLLVFSRKNFRSVMYNLLSNAFRYRSPDRDCQIHVRTENLGGYILLSVKDNGLGLNEKNKKQLFSMFKRFHSHTEGTGIGLYIVKRIMDNAGGRIEVESTEGEGWEFKVFFKQNTFTHEK